MIYKFKYDNVYIVSCEMQNSCGYKNNILHPTIKNFTINKQVDHNLFRYTPFLNSITT